MGGSTLREVVSSLVDPAELGALLLTMTESSVVGQVLISKQCLDVLVRSDAAMQVSDFRSLEACGYFVWERLNTGHWKDVDERWRQLYAAVCVLKVTCLSQLACNKMDNDDKVLPLAQDLVKLCDLGLLLGSPVLDDLCGRLASALCKICRDCEQNYNCLGVKRRKIEKCCEVPLPEVSKRDASVVTVDELAVDDFVQDFMLTGTPVVVAGMMGGWPAMSGSRRWSVDYIRRVCGYRCVPVELGKRYTDEDWTQTIMSVNEFIDRHVLETDAKVKGYLAQHQLLDQISELMEDVEVPEYCFAGQEDGVDVNSWFGPAETVSPLHTDPKHNFLCQVFGRKFVKLYKEDQSEFLYPYSDGQLLSNTSRMDLENVDLVKFPKFEEARGFNCVLEEGQMLYIPPKCWHFVKSLSPSFSVSFWFQ